MISAKASKAGEFVKLGFSSPNGSLDGRDHLSFVMTPSEAEAYADDLVDAAFEARGGSLGASRVERVAAAVRVIERFGMIDGTHHKQWCLDQIARALLGEQYETWIARMNDPEYAPWNRGIAP